MKGFPEAFPFSTDGVRQVPAPSGFSWPADAPQPVILTDGVQYRTAYDISVNLPVTQATYYVSTTGTSVNTGTHGTTPQDPLDTIIRAYNKAVTAGLSSVTIYVLSGYYYLSKTWNNTNTSITMVVLPYQGGRVVLGPHAPVTWAQNGTYPVVYSAAYTDSALEVFDAAPANLDIYGIASKLTSLTTIADVAATPGSFYLDTTGHVLYVHRLDGTAADISLMPRSPTTGGAVVKWIGVTGGGSLYLGDISVVGANRSIYCVATSGRTGVFYGRGLRVVGPPDGQANNAFQFDGINGVAQNCWTRWVGKDAFGVHTVGGGSALYMLCIDCGGIDVGSTNQTSCNVITGHDACKIISVNCYGLRNRGTAIASINVGTQHWSVGDRPNDSLGDTNPNTKVAFAALTGCTMWVSGGVDSGCDISFRADDTSTLYTHGGSHPGTTYTAGSGQVLAF